MSRCYLCKSQFPSQRLEQLDGELRAICVKCFKKLYMVDFSHDYYIRYSSKSNFIAIYIKGTLFELNLFSYEDLKKFQKRKIKKVKFNTTYLYSFGIGV